MLTPLSSETNNAPDVREAGFATTHSLAQVPFFNNQPVACPCSKLKSQVYGIGVGSGVVVNETPTDQGETEVSLQIALK